MKTILAVDNNLGVLRFLDDALGVLGFNVRLASSGKEAVAIYRSEDIDFVLLDMLMPEMDGPQTLAALMEIDPKVNCCFMASSPSAECLVGAVGILQKPFSLESLREVILEATKDQ